MGDLISRQDAIDAIDQYGSVWMEYTDSMSIEEIAERALKASKQSMIKILHDLPSAQPEIIRCKDCKHRSKSGLCNMWSVFGTVTTDDDMYCSYGERGNSDDE